MVLVNIGLGAVLGLALGSLVDCLANRSLGSQSFFGRSRCDNCHRNLQVLDLIPVFSYLSHSGRCRYCGKKISAESTVVEISLSVLMGLLFFEFLPIGILSPTPAILGFTLLDLAFKAFVICILSIFVITDLKKGLIPDRISIPAILIAFGYLLLTAGSRVILLYKSLLSNPLGKTLISLGYFQRNALWEFYPIVTALIGAVLIAAFFGGLILITRGRGMGVGDLKLGIFIGLVLNFPMSVVAILIAFLTGSIVGIFLIISKVRHFGQTIPFGPFLSLGGIVTLLWGQEILDWYLKSHLF